MILRVVNGGYSHFNDFVFDNISETALSEDERSKLVNEQIFCSS